MGKNRKREENEQREETVDMEQVAETAKESFGKLDYAKKQELLAEMVVSAQEERKKKLEENRKWKTVYSVAREKSVELNKAVRNGEKSGSDAVVEYLDTITAAVENDDTVEERD